ncbi:NAD(P)-dependent oxidoreductase [Actinomadura barringtoniae]|uniref:NAD(P)-dependent oxidoreductase n=1 Tax=Actinomadura barringtoniae TaxID=1427535 RepID=A0A939PKR8_9ACTN|nr:NAD(P)-dependent oxidoreductase [Actinomadura barringtoniae]MBO2451679.1 NAD(P)-dependent oxidoreductase [Actinomadura barringtoniae]
MRVLVAGATGVVGRQLVPLLTATGHEVIALSRGGRRQEDPAAGVETVTADALDREALEAAVQKARPDAVVHLLTAIPAELDPRKMEEQFALTNRLRTEGTRNLIAAAQAAGATRIITQGLAYAYDPDGGVGSHSAGAANEDAPFWNEPPKQWRTSLEALKDLERQTAEAGGLVLRFGHLYGPGTAFAADGSTIRQIKAHKMPIVGKGSATFSFTHTHDAATAVVAALTRTSGAGPVTGALNIVDDEPVLLRDWLPAVAEMAGAKKPGKAPAALARLAVGGWGVAFMTRLRGADNARARLELNWRPRYGSWREGFAAELGQ